MMTAVNANDHFVDAPAFRKALIAWGRNNFRPFPWRFTSDPYRLLMAEVMLHRTQARQVEPVYRTFIASFPDLQTLAGASLADLHEHLYPLGLRWRIDLIYAMVVALEEKHGGQVPVDRGELLALPGVSEYIASSVRCFAWNLPDALIDTNTVRVVGRLFSLEIKDSSRRNARFRQLIAELVDPEEPRAYNYALLDLADKVCTIKHPPQHDVCPVAGSCLYHRCLLLSREQPA